MVVGHVLLRYEVTIRSYGALSTTFRKQVGWVDAPPVSEPPKAFLPAPSRRPHGQNAGRPRRATRRRTWGISRFKAAVEGIHFVVVVGPRSTATTGGSRRRSSPVSRVTDA